MFCSRPPTGWQLPHVSIPVYSVNAAGEKSWEFLSLFRELLGPHNPHVASITIWPKCTNSGSIELTYNGSQCNPILIYEL